MDCFDRLPEKTASPRRDEYQTVVVCTLGTEFEVIKVIFDEIYPTGNQYRAKADGDRNIHTTGEIGQHHIVLTDLSGMGKVTATVSVNSIRATFRNVALVFVVSVYGGAPRTPIFSLCWDNNH